MDGQALGTLNLYASGTVQVNAGKKSVKACESDRKHQCHEEAVKTLHNAYVQQSVIRFGGRAETDAPSFTETVHYSDKTGTAETKGFMAIQNDDCRRRFAQNKLLYTCGNVGELTEANTIQYIFYGRGKSFVTNGGIETAAAAHGEILRLLSQNGFSEINTAKIGGVQDVVYGFCRIGRQSQSAREVVAGTGWNISEGYSGKIPDPVEDFIDCAVSAYSDQREAGVLSCDFLSKFCGMVPMSGEIHTVFHILLIENFLYSLPDFLSMTGT